MKLALAPPPSCCGRLNVARSRGVAEVESGLVRVQERPLACATPRAAAPPSLAKQGEKRGESHVRSNEFDRTRDIAWS